MRVFPWRMCWLLSPDFCAFLQICSFIVGFPDAGNSISGILGAILSDFMQQNLINETFCAPIATHMEIAVIQALRQYAGFSTKEPVKKIRPVR